MKKYFFSSCYNHFITLLLPLAIVWLIGGSGEGQSPIESGTVSVYVSEEDCVKDMDINEYLKCVVAAEIADFEEEALKAQAVAAKNLSVLTYCRKKTKQHCRKSQRCGDMHRFNALSGVYFGG